MSRLPEDRYLAELYTKDSIQATFLQNLVDAINNVAKRAGVAPFGEHPVPPPVNAITVKASGEMIHATLTHAAEVTRAIEYRIEADTNPGFTAPHTVAQGSSRTHIIHLPTYNDAGQKQNWYLRAFAQYPDSKPSQPTVLGGRNNPTAITLQGTSKMTLLPSTGSGTASTTGQQGGAGRGKQRVSTPKVIRIGKAQASNTPVVAPVTGPAVALPVDPSQGGVLAKGALPGTLNSGFSYTATTSSVTPQWSGLAVYRADGTQTIIGSGSQLVSSLGSGKTFYLYPRYNESAASLNFVQNSDVSFPNMAGVTFASGSSQEVTTSTSAALTAAFSIECWMKVASAYAGNGGLTKATNQTGLISSANTVVNISWNGTGNIQAVYRDSGGTLHTITSPNAYNDGAWHHVVYVCDPTNSSQALYIDGVQVATDTQSTAVSATAGYYRLARDFANIFLSGTMSEVAVYNVALSATQVMAHFNAMNSTSQSNYESAVLGDAPTIWWKLRETSGTSAADSGSIGGNTGTYVNSPSLNQSSPVLAAIGSPAIAWPQQSLLLAQAQRLQGYIPLTKGGWAVATPSSGSGGGSLGGSTDGTGAGCFSGNTLVQTPNANVAIRDLRAGDTVIAKLGPRKILEVLRHEPQRRIMLDMGKGELVTPDHLIFFDSRWQAAAAKFGGPIGYDGAVYNLSVEGRDFEDHSFALANGTIAHNEKVF